MKEIVIFDTEYWCDQGSPQRNWNGIYDQPPLLVQIGAFIVSLEDGLPITNEFLAYVIPRNERGEKIPLTKHFIELTKITPEILEKEGQILENVISSFKIFTRNLNFYSYGYDLLRTIVPSCFIEGIACPFNPRQSGDIRRIFQKAGLTDYELDTNSSGTIAEYLGADRVSSFYPHDARNDAMSLIEAIRILHKRGDLSLEWF